MRIHIRFDRNFWTSRTGLAIAGSAAVLVVVCVVTMITMWVHYGRMMDQRLSGPVFEQASAVMSAPGKIEVGQPFTGDQLISYLQHAGYSAQPNDGSIGWYQGNGSSVEIHPSASSYFEGTNALRVDFAGGKVAAIRRLDDGQTTDSASLEPVVLTSLFGDARVKRRVLHYDELPATLVQAVVSAEDKRFFTEPGIDIWRIFGAAMADLRLGRKAQGASTITMQVARSFFFSRARTWRRKVEETLMALELEHRFTKQQIFTLYANQVYLGNRGSFALHGFGAAAQSYFGKDVRDLNVAQDAFLAGIIRAPNHYASSYSHRDRAIDARDRVLEQMVDDGYLSKGQETAAKQLPLDVQPAALSTSDAPYFVDLVRNLLLQKYTDSDLATQSYRIYTTLDPELERAATQAVADGMKLVDQRLARRYAKWEKLGQPAPRPQVALVALDPQTGEVRALVGGRSYGESQLDHALAHRQPGSVFKPFVYAAAFLTGLDGQQPVITPVTTVLDEPTTFSFDGTEYTPDNYEQEFFGEVTAREALTHSLNVATVKFAQMVGYDRVAQLAKQMKLTDNIQPTPAMALGSYEMTPIDVAGGYTAFAENGIRAEPIFLREMTRKDGTVLEQVKPQTSPVLDPRVAFLVTSVMQNVLNHGTGFVVRSMGFNAPAAGKTGTSHDGWFAGFTSQLECIVWVGFDDNRELGLAGADSAGPIWAEFMKSALQIPGYDKPQPFAPPGGVVEEAIDPATNELATAQCPDPQDDFFIVGTQPTLQSPGSGMVAAQLPAGSGVGGLVGGGNPPPPSAGRGSLVVPKVPGQLKGGSAATPAAAPGSSAAKPEKKGFFQRIFGIFGGKKKSPAHSPPGPQGEPQP